MASAPLLLLLSPHPSPPGVASCRPRLVMGWLRMSIFRSWGHMQAAICNIQYSCPDLGRNEFVIFASAHTMVQFLVLILIQAHSCQRVRSPSVGIEYSSRMASGSNASQESRFGGKEQIVLTYQEGKDYQDEITQNRTPIPGRTCTTLRPESCNRIRRIYIYCRSVLIQTDTKGHV